MTTNPEDNYSVNELAKGLAKEFYQLVTRVAVLESQVIEREEALRIQAREYERRLEELRNADFISREVYDSRHQALLNRTDIIERQMVTRPTWEEHKGAIENRFTNSDARMNEFDNWRARIIGISVGISIGAGLAGGVISALLSRLFK